MNKEELRLARKWVSDNLSDLEIENIINRQWDGGIRDFIRANKILQGAGLEKTICQKCGGSELFLGGMGTTQCLGCGLEQSA